MARSSSTLGSKVRRRLFALRFPRGSRRAARRRRGDGGDGFRVRPGRTRHRRHRSSDSRVPRRGAPPPRFPASRSGVAGPGVCRRRRLLPRERQGGGLELVEGGHGTGFRRGDRARENADVRRGLHGGIRSVRRGTLRRHPSRHTVRSGCRRRQPLTKDCRHRGDGPRTVLCVGEPATPPP